MSAVLNHFNTRKNSRMIRENIHLTLHVSVWVCMRLECEYVNNVFCGIETISPLSWCHDVDRSFVVMKEE